MLTVSVQDHDMAKKNIRVGGLAPLGRPGFFEAGLQLKAGLELGVEEVNSAGRESGRPSS